MCPFLSGGDNRTCCRVPALITRRYVDPAVGHGLPGDRESARCSVGKHRGETAQR